MHFADLTPESQERYRAILADLEKQYGASPLHMMLNREFEEIHPFRHCLRKVLKKTAKYFLKVSG